MFIGFPWQQVLLGCVRDTEEIETDGFDLIVASRNLLPQSAAELKSDLGNPKCHGPSTALHCCLIENQVNSIKY